MRNAEVENNLITLNSMATKHFPVKLSFAIAVNIEELMKWHKQIEKQRIALLERNGKKDENGACIQEDGHYQLEDEKGFLTEFNELLETEVEPEIHKVAEDVLAMCDSQEKYDVPTVAEMGALRFMLE